MNYHIRPRASSVIGSFREIEGWAAAEVALIAHFPWTTHNPRPVTEVRLLYDPTNLYARFDCTEKYVHAEHTEDQSEVWKDNCVELFVSPSSDLSASYFNFEFNCLGKLLLAVGHGREGRVAVPRGDLLAVRRECSYKKPVDLQDESLKHWFLAAAIPFELLHRYSGTPAPGSGTVWRANFNKCAESVKEPHWGTWAPVDTVTPDFHQPKFFGELHFV
ncbi:MAG: hypothetical protein GHCLOJNM_03858 [bacterium]|nr:hypothetical protein [bacterium]